MKRITALLLTAVLLVSTIQPVYAADSTSTVSPDQATKSTASQPEDLTFKFTSKDSYAKTYYGPDSTDNTGAMGYAGHNKSSSPITFSVSSSNTDILKITSNTTRTVGAYDHFFEVVKFDCFKAGYVDITVSTEKASFKTHYPEMEKDSRYQRIPYTACRK